MGKMSASCSSGGLECSNSIPLWLKLNIQRLECILGILSSEML